LVWHSVLQVKTVIFEAGVIKIEKEREFGDLKARDEKALRRTGSRSF